MNAIDLPARIVVEDDRVILRGDLATSVLLDVAWDETPEIERFKELFEFQGTSLREEDYYQGLRVMAVIRRKADGRLFGYPYFDDISKHGEAHYESNGDEHGIGGYEDYKEEWCVEGGDGEDDLNEAYVWLPVEPFTITGYRIPEAKAEEVAA